MHQPTKHTYAVAVSPIDRLGYTETIAGFNGFTYKEAMARAETEAQNTANRSVVVWRQTRTGPLAGLWKRVKAFPVGAAIIASLTLSTPTLAHDAPTFDQPVPTWQRPASDAFVSGCIVEETHDDGSRIAYCPEDGSTIAYDPDGQRFPNQDGTPLRMPGNWYVVNY